MLCDQAEMRYKGMLRDVLGILIVGAVCVYAATEIIRLIVNMLEEF